MRMPCQVAVLNSMTTLRTLLYAVQCPIQNCHILALMDAGFFHDSVRIRIGPTLLDPSPSAIPIGHVQAQDLSA